jgi:DNA-binding MarR family transcriptional regulator
MEALFEHEELTFSQWTTLVALHDGRIRTAGDLAHNICHDAGSLTRLIDQLVRRALVVRSRSQTDRRVVTLALTPPGCDMVEALAPRVMNLWNELLTGFTHAEVETLIRLLTRLLVATEDKLRGDKPSRLVISDAPISTSDARRSKSPRPKVKTP